MSSEEKTGAWLSPISIVDSKILDFSFETMGDPNGVEVDNTVSVSLTHGGNTDNGDIRTCKCVLNVDSSWLSKDDQTPLYRASCRLGIVISAPKEYLGQVPEEEADIYLTTNAVSIAYGKIRDAIESVTAESVMGRLSIPLIQPRTLVEEFKKQEENSDA